MDARLTMLLDMPSWAIVDTLAFEQGVYPIDEYLQKVIETDNVDNDVVKVTYHKKTTLADRYNTSSPDRNCVKRYRETRNLRIRPYTDWDGHEADQFYTVDDPNITDEETQKNINEFHKVNKEKEKLLAYKHVFLAREEAWQKRYPSHSHNVAVQKELHKMDLKWKKLQAKADDLFFKLLDTSELKENDVWELQGDARSYSGTAEDIYYEIDIIKKKIAHNKYIIEKWDMNVGMSYLDHDDDPIIDAIQITFSKLLDSLVPLNDRLMQLYDQLADCYTHLNEIYDIAESFQSLEPYNQILPKEKVFGALAEMQ